MRNDARPIGEDSPASPIGGDTAREGGEQEDPRDAHEHGRLTHIVNRQAERRTPDAPSDPVMPSSDSSLNTKV
jgi:hypothetical protein